MQDVGEDQFLMLLLVVQAEFDQGRHGRQRGRLGVFQEARHGRRHLRPVGHRLVHAGPGDHAAAGPRVARAGALVVGVEKKGEIGVERPIGGGMDGQDELLEEPGRMGQMPLAGTGVLHRLDHLVLGREDPGQGFGLGADGVQAFDQRTAVVRRFQGGAGMDGTGLDGTGMGGAGQGLGHRGRIPCGECA